MLSHFNFFYRRFFLIGSLICLFSNASFADPIHQNQVFFDNQSHNDVYLLPEKGGDPVKVPARTKIFQPMDAFCDPTVFSSDSRFAVFKIVDNISVTYLGRDDVKTSGGSFQERTGQALKGGWKAQSWAEANPYFGNFLRKALDQNP